MAVQYQLRRSATARSVAQSGLALTPTSRLYDYTLSLQLPYRMLVSILLNTRACTLVDRIDILE